jgi:hypothetical protein
MTSETSQSPDLQEALKRGALERLPLTFLPFVNQQLAQWDYLFPSERQSVEQLLTYAATLSPEQCAALFADVVRLEDKMGVRKWRFSTREQTIQNSSQLAGSPYFQEWRHAVQAVYDKANAFAASSRGGASQPVNRLVLLDIPSPLPVDRASAWRRWQDVGKPIKLDLTSAGAAVKPMEFLLNGSPGVRAEGLVDAIQRRSDAVAADNWIIDAGRNLADSILAAQPPAKAPAKTILLSYSRLDACRQNFSHEMNSMRKDLADADAVFDRLRKVDIASWCPLEVASEPATREFVRSVYLSGNGAVIFGNSFAQWAASEAFRRARPRFVAATFGMRAKPKPFTGVAVFDNPDQVNPLPSVDDLPGSALDAEILALYVWLAAARFDEYQRSTLCVCLAESLSEAYVVAPSGFTVREIAEPLPLDLFRDALRNWIA